MINIILGVPLGRRRRGGKLWKGLGSRKMVSCACGAGGTGCHRISFPLSLTTSLLTHTSHPLSGSNINLYYRGREWGRVHILPR